jgi:hypothetical protein
MRLWKGGRLTLRGSCGVANRNATARWSTREMTKAKSETRFINRVFSKIISTQQNPTTKSRLDVGAALVNDIQQARSANAHGLRIARGRA